MPISPIPISVLLLDDGELDGIDQILRRLGADFLRLCGNEIHGEIQRPRDLLVTSGKRTFNMPRLESVEGTTPPTWLCVHNQDFLPLRERMRGQGVNFLAHSALDQEALRLFLLQTLYTGGERRASRRLPLGVEVTISVGKQTKVVRLLEVSSESCRILTPEPLSSGVRVSLTLPQAISAGSHGELWSMPVRSSACQTRTGEFAYSTVLLFDEMAVATRRVLERIARGEQIGTRLSPLAGARSSAGLPSPPARSAEVRPSAPAARSREVTQPAATSDQRGTPRYAYNRGVQLLDLCDSDAETTAVGCDLSLDGIRIDGYPELGSGSRVTLALYAGPREEPLIVSASVVRSTGADDVAFCFEQLTSVQKNGIERLLAAPERLESLDSGECIVMTKIIDDV